MQITNDKPAQDCIHITIINTHLTDMPLNFQLNTHNTILIEQTTNATHYHLFALPNTVPPKPDLTRITEDDTKIIVEL